MKFTKATLADLQCPPGRTEAMVYDDTLPGFGLRLNAGGKATFFIQFRIGLKQRRMSIGNRATMSVDEARKRAKVALGAAADGVDAQAKRQAAKAQAAVTFGSIVPRYLAYAKSRHRPSHHDATKRYLERYLSTLSNLPVALITRADVSAQIDDIAEKYGLYAANRARSAISALYIWAMTKGGVADANPVVGTGKATDERARDRVLTDAELVAAWRLSGDRDFGHIVRLLALTGQRREEVSGMRWSELDLDNGIWTLPAGRVKNKNPHTVPLAPAALEIIAQIPRRVGRDLLFGSADGPFRGYSDSKARLDKAMSGHLPTFTPWRLHDLRRTAATRMIDLGVLPHVVEAVLNHLSGHRAGVAGVYNRSTYAKEKRAALDLWACHVMSLVSGNGE